MTLIVTRISVAEAATIINAFITFISFTVALFLVVLLIKFLPTTTTAIAWSSISRTLHSSLWPTVLRTDSGLCRTEGAVVSILSRLGTLTTILVAVAGVILPLGLSEGPIAYGNARLLKGTYIPDNSPLALSTTPNQGSFVYGRQCGSFRLVACPGNDNPNTTTIAPSILEMFNSTPHGPFSMKFRRFYQGEEKVSVGFEASAETFILRDDISFAEGVIIDMRTEQPGIGLWNQTVPTEVEAGGTWTQNILWIEPETECVDTNLTVDYFLMRGPNLSIDEFNITDHGGFYNLPLEPPPPLNRDGQNIDLRQHAYKGAAYSNLFAMLFLNATGNKSSEGSTYPLSSSHGPYTRLSGSDLQKVTTLPLSYLNNTESLNIICQGFGGADTANITNVHVSCGIVLGPPLRTDGGDPRTFDRGSKWTQGIHACSSATRVSVQTVTFSSNSSTNMQGLQISREKKGLDVLWATEKTNSRISEVDLFWGRVDDRYENDSSLWTIRSNRFYLPAGTSSIFTVLSDGMPGVAHTQTWGAVYDDTGIGQQDYSGETDYALKAKLQTLVEMDPIRGNAQIRNLIFTDIMANNVIGTQTNDTLMVAEHLKTISYDFRYAIPGLLLLAIWIPSFLLSALLFITRTVTFTHMKQVLNHTSVGRVVVGSSALRVPSRGGGTLYMPVPHNNDSDADTGDASRFDGSFSGDRRNKNEVADDIGSIPVTLDLNNSPSSARIEENVKLMESHLPHV